MSDEQDRTVAILKGSYLARWFPDVWRSQQIKTDRAKEMREVIERKMKQLKEKRNGNN